MAYSVNALSTAADCDVLLNISAKEKSDLEFKKISLQRQQTNYSKSAVEIDTELQAIAAELTALATVIASLPDGDIKDDTVKKQKKLQLKHFLLEERKENYGSVALLEKEFNLARTEKELQETDAFIAALQARKATL